MSSDAPMIPGSPRADRAAMLRVNQAGEYGATRIYAGQLAVMGDRTPASRIIAGMAAQEAPPSRPFRRDDGPSQGAPHLVTTVLGHCRIWPWRFHRCNGSGSGYGMYRRDRNGN